MLIEIYDWTEKYYSHYLPKAKVLRFLKDFSGVIGGVEIINILVVPCTDWLRGSVQRLHHFSKEWSKRHNIYIFNLQRDDHAYEAPCVKEQEYFTLIRVPTIKSMNFALLIILNFLPQLLYFLRIIKSAKIDVLVAEGLGVSNAALIAAKILKRRIVFDYSDFYISFIELYVQNSLMRKILQPIARLMTNINIRFSDATVVVSDKLLDEGQRYTRSIYKIINGVCEEYFSNSQEQHKCNDDHVIITFVGAIEPWVSFENVITAIVNLNRKMTKKFTLKIVGDGSKLTAFKEYIEKKGLLGTVKFTGWVPYAKVHEHIEKSDICILPFDNSSISAFSMPIKINEYAISKKPIIATPLPEIRKIYGSSVIYATTTQEYMRGIMLLLEDREVKLRLIKEAYEIAKKYSWETLAKDYEKILLGR